MHPLVQPSCAAAILATTLLAFPTQSPAAEDNIWLGQGSIAITNPDYWTNGFPDANDNLIFGAPFDEENAYPITLLGETFFFEELTVRDDYINFQLGGIGDYHITGIPPDPNAVATSRFAPNSGETTSTRFSMGTITSHGGADVAVAPGTHATIEVYPMGNWNIFETFRLGRHGDAVLDIIRDSTLNTERTVLAAFAGSTAEVTIAGEDAVWQNTGEFIAGAAGPSTITAANTASLTTGPTVIGAAPGFHSLAQFFSPDTHWDVTADLRVGTVTAPTESAATGRVDLNFGAYLTVADDLNVTANGVLQLNQGFASIGTGPAPTTPSTLDVYSDGTLGGAGQVIANVVSAGTIAPGDSFGILNVDGNVSLGTTSQLVIEVAGTTPGEHHDQLAATGAAALDGHLQVVVPITPYDPSVGDEIQILSYASAVGDFTSFSGLDAFPERFLVPQKNATDYRLVAALAGDANLDNVVNGLDANILTVNWLATGVGYAAGDVNLDGVVDGLDANVVSANFLNSAPASAPEPTALLLALTTLVSLGFRRRCR